MSYDSKDIFKNLPSQVPTLIMMSLIDKFMDWLKIQKKRIFQEQLTIKKILNLYHKWFTLRGYHFVAGVALKLVSAIFYQICIFFFCQMIAF